MSVSGEASGRRFTVETVPANLLETDPAVQRKLNPMRVAKLAEAFDESALGVFTVSLRETPYASIGEEHAPKPRYVVLDGQTRLAALRAFTGTEKTTLPVVCQVFRGLTRAEEAEIFLTHNDRAAVKSIDKFRIALIAGERWAIDLNDLVIRHGFEADTNAPPERRFTAVSTALRISRLADGREALERAFDLIVRSWGHRTNACSAEAVDGLGLLYHRHGAAVDTVGFAKRLARKETPQTFKANVMAHRGALRLSRTEAAYHYTLEVYNAGLRSNRLEARK